MTIWRLVTKEILHRKLNFALAVLSVLVAVAVVVAQLTLLRAHDLCTEELLARKQSAAARRLAKLEDDYRKYMKELGFNLLILPKDQDLAEFWEKGYTTHTMPEANVAKLSNSGTVLIRHLLPIIQQRVLWPERKRRVILIGTRGEVPLAHRRPKEPMLLAVPVGKAVLGYEIAHDLGIKPGDEIKLMGRSFVVHKCRPQRGSADDATIWVDLKAAQEMLDMTGRINAVEALKCQCKGVTVQQLKDQVAGYLDHTVKVVVRENKVTLRGKARNRAAQENRAAMAAERAGRGDLRRTRESFAGVVVPLVLVGSAAWVGLLALSNVRERSTEIGIHRAIGVHDECHIYPAFHASFLKPGGVGAKNGVSGLPCIGNPRLLRQLCCLINRILCGHDLRRVQRTDSQKDYCQQGPAKQDFSLGPHRYCSSFSIVPSGDGTGSTSLP